LAMNSLSRLFGWLLLVCCASCLRTKIESQRPDLSIPKGTGKISINMAGTWEIHDLVLLAGRRAGDPGSSSGSGPSNSPGIVPPTNGDRIEFSKSEFLKGDGLPMRKQDLDASEGRVLRYYNFLDGKVGLYHVTRKSRPDVADGGSTELSIALGSVHATEVAGALHCKIVRAQVARGTLIEGLYRFRLRRVAPGR